ncbi:ComEC/Rec2 family competence protein [Arthrobacter sp. UM1]|nr:ComEC/Rec2 family competence protein [Arthrobacter sp. UM1]
MRVREPGTRDRGAAALVIAGEAVATNRAWYRPLRVARVQAEQAFAQTAGPRSGRVAAAMVYGGDPGDPQAAASMKTAGLAHLTAVSGANCALAAAAGLLAVRVLRGGRGLQAAVTLGTVGAFALLCGPDATVLRAAVMGSLAALALLHGRGRSGLCLLSAAVVLLLAWDPWLSLDLGFGLSASATMGILLWARPFTSLLDRVLPGWIAAPAAVAASAGLGCHPLLALMLPSLPGLSLPANLLVGALVAPVTFCGLAVLGTAWVWPGAAAALAWGPNRAVDLILAVAEFVAAHPANRSPLPVGIPGMLLGIAAWALPWMLQQWLARRTESTWHPQPPRGRRRTAMAGWAAASILVAVLPFLRPSAGVVDGWQLALCDVGQGDAAVVRSGAHAILVDAGPPGDAAARCLQELGVRELDAVILSHLHADHRGGLPAVRRRHPGGPGLLQLREHGGQSSEAHLRRRRAAAPCGCRVPSAGERPAGTGGAPRRGRPHSAEARTRRRRGREPGEPRQLSPPRLVPARRGRADRLVPRRPGARVGLRSLAGHRRSGTSRDQKGRRRQGPAPRSSERRRCVCAAEPQGSPHRGRHGELLRPSPPAGPGAADRGWSPGLPHRQARAGDSARGRRGPCRPAQSAVTPPERGGRYDGEL